MLTRFRKSTSWAMGPWTSRPTTSSIAFTSPNLPFDIYVEVFGYLRPSLVEDRKALLALCLSSTDLREAGQRVLFRKMHCGLLSFDPDRPARVIRTHSKFLSAIINSPDRLALFVTSYAQQRLALDPTLRSIAKELSMAHQKEHMQLWTLTETALPLMINLKSLTFAPLLYRPSAPMLLQNCTFQLSTLTWEGYGSESALYTVFLPTQHNLEHLNINADSYDTRPALPDGLCPRLASIACQLDDLPRVCVGRPMVALHVANSPADIARPPRRDLDIMSAAERQVCIAALKSIRYLRIWALARFQQSTNGVTLPNITILQIRVWSIEDSTLLIQFPNLRSLHLRNPSSSNIDSSLHRQTALRVFRASPTIQSVLIIARSSHSEMVYRFLPRHDGGVDEEIISMDDYVDVVWWKI